MLERFAEHFDKELEMYESPFELMILSSTEIRAFVYEVCKRCIQDELRSASQQSVQADANKCICVGELRGLDTCPVCGGIHEIRTA